MYRIKDVMQENNNKLAVLPGEQVNIRMVSEVLLGPQQGAGMSSMVPHLHRLGIKEVMRRLYLSDATVDGRQVLPNAEVLPIKAGTPLFTAQAFSAAEVRWSYRL